MARDIQPARAHQRAEIALERAIAQARNLGGSLLPTIGELSRRADVSYKTMWKAVCRAREAGVLDARAGTRLRLPQTQTPSGSLSVHQGAMQRIVLALKDRIARGIYPPGMPLPSLKELSHDPGGNYRTVRKALDRLCEEGLCAHHGSRFLVAEDRSSQASMQVMLIRSVRYPHHSPETTPRRAYMLHMLQDEAHRRRLVLHETHFSPLYGRMFGSGADMRHASGKLDRERLLGVIVWTSGMTDQAFERLLPMLRSWGRPVMLIDETGKFASLLSTRNPPVGVIRLGDTLHEGRIVAQYLLGKGHRHIACIYPEHHVPLANLRIEGLRSTIDESGPQTSFTFLSGFQAVKVGDNPFREAVRGFSAKNGTAFQRALQGMDDALELAEQEAMDEAARNMKLVSADIVRRQVMRNLCARVLERGDVSAIVAFNDDCALDALRFMHERGVKVPEDMAIVGFDDSEPSYVGSITSYHHNLSEAAHDIYHFLLTAGTTRFDRARYAAPVEVLGHVVERATT